jgi:radical SAM superfamily enzyme with C-terminal helix-hairpin-helix motif
MLEFIFPKGCTVKKIRAELYKGSLTYARNIGTYPLTFIIPYVVKLSKFP